MLIDYYRLILPQILFVAFVLRLERWNLLVEKTNLFTGAKRIVLPENSPRFHNSFNIFARWTDSLMHGPRKPPVCSDTPILDSPSPPRIPCVRHICESLHCRITFMNSRTSNVYPNRPTMSQRSHLNSSPENQSTSPTSSTSPLIHKPHNWASLFHLV